jgi:hypothetical protein
MQIDWGATTSAWNQALFEKFHEYFMATQKNSKTGLEISEDELEEMFYGLIQRFKREIKKAKSVGGLNPDDSRKRLQEIYDIEKAKSRPSQRRRQVSDK